MNKTDKIYIAGHSGLLGISLLNRLQKEGYTNLIYQTRNELDLRNDQAVNDFLLCAKPDYVFLTAGRVGGIIPNDKFPADFLYENVKIQVNLIHSSYLANVKKLLYIGCSCIYPRESPQPVKEESLLTGKFEPTNEAYATAKLTGLMMCRAYNRQYGTNFIACIADNLYGPNDRFDELNAHVVPALIRKFRIAIQEGHPTVKVWGSGKPKRGLLYVDELTDACLFLMQTYNSPDIINVGSGKSISVRELAELVKDITGFKGTIEFEHIQPDGIPEKVLDVSKLNSLGWYSKVTLPEGIRKTYQWYINEKK